MSQRQLRPQLSHLSEFPLAECRVRERQHAHAYDKFVATLVEPQPPRRCAREERA